MPSRVSVVGGCALFLARGRHNLTVGARQGMTSPRMCWPALRRVILARATAISIVARYSVCQRVGDMIFSRCGTDLPNKQACASQNALFRLQVKAPDMIVGLVTARTCATWALQARGLDVAWAWHGKEALGLHEQCLKRPAHGLDMLQMHGHTGSNREHNQ